MSEHSEGYRLSPQQRRLQRVSSLDPGQYVAQASFEVEGRLDVERLRAAVRSLVRRHEVLRTSLSERSGGGVPLQLIGDGTNDCFEFVRGTECEAVDGERSGADSSLRVRCEQRGDEQWQVRVSLGAMWSDAEGMATLCEQMWAAYDEVDADEESEESPLQYVDFSEWQNGLLESEESEAGRAFWRRHDPQHLPPLRLSSESESARGASFTPECFDEALDDELLEAVRAASESCEAEVDEFLLACWMCLLYRLSTNADVVVNIFERRKHEELEGAIGLIGRALPVHCQFDQKIAFGEVLKRTRRTVVELSKWQEYYTDDDTHLDQRTDSLPQHPFIFEHLRRPVPFATPDATTCLRLLGLRAHTEPFRIKLVASPRAGRLRLEWHYDPRRFDSTSVRRLAAQYLRLLASATTDPACAVARLELLTDEERHTSLVEWNRTEVDYGGTHCLHQLFEQQAARTPDAIALAYENERLTYAELNGSAERFARLLSMKGVGPDVVVGLMMERSVEMVVALLAVLKAGGAYLPLDPEYPADRLSFMLEDSAVSLLLTQRRLRDRVPEHVAEVVCMDSLLIDDGLSVDGYDDINVTPDSLAYVIYTSGSTGRPKGVMVSHRAISNRLLWMREHYPLTLSDALLQKTSLSFDASVWELFHPLQSGARLLLARPGGERDLEYLVETVATQGVTV
ncbi:MAG TPA: AMP-binding protein, partial [Pyrinomonadaceae bacterium]